MTLPRMPLLCCAAALAAGAWAVLPARADGRHDHEQARAAMQAGQVLPLQKVLAQVLRDHPGEVLEVELEREDGRWVYELRLLQRGGSLLRLDVDARTAEVLGRRPPPPLPASAPRRPR